MPTAYPAEPHAQFGRAGVVDLVHLIGLYVATAAFLNAFDVPAPVDGSA